MQRKNAKIYAPALNISEDSLVISAVLGNKAIRERQTFLYNTEHKIATTLDLLDLGLKTIMFSQSTKFVDHIHSLHRDSVIYHSGISSQVRIIYKEKQYKSLQAARKFAEKVNGTIKGNTVIYPTTKVVGPDVLKKEAINAILSNKCKVILTAKALDQGFDVEDMELGINTSYISNPTQYIQRTGRIARNYTNQEGKKKKGVFINLYIPSTRDEGWLRATQAKNKHRVIWVNSLDEAKQLIDTAT